MFSELTKFSVFFLVRTCKLTFTQSQFSNGHFTPNKKEFGIGENVEFSCSSGFRLRGGTRYICTSSGQWSTVGWPRCVGMYLLLSTR